MTPRTSGRNRVRIIAGKSVTLRLARGLGPLPLPLAASIPMLALGGHQKVALAVSNGIQAVLGPHVGDLDDVATLDRFQKHQGQLCELYGARPRCIVRDLHPDYATTRWAGQQSLPTIAVQHHHAF